jgi:hypothetical protein
VSPFPVFEDGKRSSFHHRTMNKVHKPSSLESNLYLARYQLAWLCLMVLSRSTVEDQHSYSFCTSVLTLRCCMPQSLLVLRVGVRLCSRIDLIVTVLRSHRICVTSLKGNTVRSREVIRDYISLQNPDYVTYVNLTFDLLMRSHICFTRCGNQY